ncbi:MAG TPA: hypothetical protein VJ044_15920, partial [Candidatus Hodarchaeales archaeon]|nr:hypothetical protein [Candidatus Hodarchaeales archaeon]
ITITHGTNKLCELDHLKRTIDDVFRGRVQRQNKIELWDGKTAERIVDVLRKFSNQCERNDAEKVKE